MLSGYTSEGSSTEDILQILDKIDHFTIDKELSFEKTKIERLKQRLLQSRFHLAIIGQLKRGKTTLINALLGQELLPSAVVPITSVPALISWGTEIKVGVIFKSGQKEEYILNNALETAKLIEQFVSEQKNPGNYLKVDRVEIQYPSNLLSDGLVIIDTPGIGSTLQHNTESTLSFLPECDAALFIFSPDPPVTQTEMDFLKIVSSRVVKIMFVLNKIDYLEERDCRLAEDFLRSALIKAGFLTHGDSIFKISAKQGLEAKIKNDMHLWRNSGLAELEEILLGFMVMEKKHALNLAIAKKAQDIIVNILTFWRLRERAICMPLDDLEKRMVAFQERLEEAERQRIIFNDLLAGDLRRSIEILEQKTSTIYKNSYSEMLKVIEEILNGEENIDVLERKVKSRFNHLIPEIFDNSFKTVSQEIKELIENTLQSYRDKVMGLIQFVYQNATELFEIPSINTGGEFVFEMRLTPYWVSERWDCTTSLVPEGLLNKFLTRSKRLKRLKKKLIEDADSICSRNTGNLQWALKQNIEDNFRSFISEIDSLLDNAINITRGAIEAIYRYRFNQKTQMTPEIEKIRENINVLNSLFNRLSQKESGRVM